MKKRNSQFVSLLLVVVQISHLPLSIHRLVAGEKPYPTKIHQEERDKASIPSVLLMQLDPLLVN